MARVRVEQAVYGSFPFRDTGYALLGRSPGCRPEWLDAFAAACQGLGEPPRGVSADGAMFAFRVPKGPWLAVGVSTQGADDRGRPGALAFHGLFITRHEFARANFDPFALTCAFRRDWGPCDSSLGPVFVDANPTPPGLACTPTARRIRRGRRVAVESATPVDALARETWADLPIRDRRRASVATLAFANPRRFDLVAGPRLASLAIDRSYADATKSSLALPIALASLGLAATLGLALSRGRPGPRADGPPTARPIEASPIDPQADIPTSTADRVLVAEGLADLAGRFGVPSTPGEPPAATIRRLADALRYRGPLLGEEERARLASTAGPEPARALEWDAHIRRFVDDRPLPADLDAGPLRRQLDLLCWTLHAPIDGSPSAAEVPHALGDALCPAMSTRPSPLAAEHPALAHYARFLGRLPRR